MSKINKFLYSFFLVGLTALFCSSLTQIGIHSWYYEIAKPPFTPPDSVFPVIWTILYILMAISFWLILLDAHRHELHECNLLFISQLMLQIIWCFLFFYGGYIGLAFGILLLLDFLVFHIIRIFRHINRGAAWLLYPYFIWICFATFLNFAFIYSLGLFVVF